eukprot:GILJ01005822.1.p1 GENE.GILJ01005822.1~~GILJ01005822.1.p1  ORF type:complete len:372 (-),score=47.76 GILJ01005822.1:82-1197(-)
MVLNSKIVARPDGPFGWGIYATDTIEENEHVWWLSEEEREHKLHVFTRQQVLQMPEEEKKHFTRLAYMLDDDTYAGSFDVMEDDSNFMNHSCEPTCWFVNDDLMVATRRILAGEEITYDYATSETEMSFHAGMVCGCNTAQCRKMLTCSEYRSKRFVEKYKGHFTSYVHRKVNSLSWHNPNVYVRRSPDSSDPFLRKGVFTAKPIAAGEIIACFVGKVVTTQELLEYPSDWLAFSLQVHDNLFQVPFDPIGPGDVPDYINHSCAANCGMEDSTIVVALRDLAAEEEVTIDYGTINSGIIWLEGDNFECHCNAADCRKKVTASDYLLKSVQERYGRYFSTFLLHKIWPYERERKRSSCYEGNGHSPQSHQLE